MGVKKPTKTLVETDRFCLYSDGNDKFWLWNKVEQINHAIRAETERMAWVKAMGSAIHLQTLHREARHAAETKLSKLETAFEDAFPREDDW